MKIKYERIAIIIVLTLLLSMPIVYLPTPVRADPGTIHVPPDYTTISAAIAAANPGDTILVAAGVYNEEVSIDKSLTIQGDGADTTIIDGTGLTLTHNALVTITATGNVIFSGFTIRNAPIVPDSDDLRICLLTRSNLAGPTYTVSYNKIYGSNNPDEYNDYGFYASNGKEDILFTHNLVTETGCNNILVEQHTGKTEISYNTLDAGVWGIDAIFFMTYDGVDVTTLQKVSYNTFDMGTGGPLFDYDHRATGVSFCSVYPYYDTSSPAKFTNMVVSDNTFNNLQSYRRGIGFWIGGTGNDLISPTITGNTITGLGQPPESSGIDFVGSGTVSGANIIGNTISGTAAGIILRSGDASGAKIYFNNIAGNTVGLDWTGGSQADARFNWWGSATGPSPPGDPVIGNAITSQYMQNQFMPTTLSIPQVTETPSDLGNTFTVPVISYINDLFGFDIKITWDNTLITFLSLDDTSLHTVWPQGFFEPLPSPGYQTGDGYVRLSAVATGGSGYMGAGPTMLFMITFTIVRAGNFPYSTSIHFDTVKLSDHNANKITATTTDGPYSMSATKPSIQFTLVDPNSGKRYEYGKYFEVQVYATSITSSLTGFDLTIDYSSELLTFISVHDWGVLGSGSKDSSVPGIVHLTLTSSSTPYTGSKGLLFTLTFKVAFTFSAGRIWRTGSAQSLSAAISLDTGSGSLGFSEGTIAIAGVTTPSPIPLTIYLIQGDADCNGKVDVFDLRCVAYYYDQAAPPGSDAARFDVETDGTIDFWDIVRVSTNYGYYVPDTQP